MNISGEIKRNEHQVTNIEQNTYLTEKQATWPTYLTSKQKDFIVIFSPEIISEFFNFELNHENRYFYCHLTNGEKLIRLWLIFSNSMKIIFYFCCKLFDRTPKSNLVINEYSD